MTNERDILITKRTLDQSIHNYVSHKENKELGKKKKKREVNGNCDPKSKQLIEVWKGSVKTSEQSCENVQ